MNGELISLPTGVTQYTVLPLVAADFNWGAAFTQDINKHVSHSDLLARLQSQIIDGAVSSVTLFDTTLVVKSINYSVEDLVRQRLNMISGKSDIKRVYSATDLLTPEQIAAWEKDKNVLNISLDSLLEGVLWEEDKWFRLPPGTLSDLDVRSVFTNDPHNSGLYKVKPLETQMMLTDSDSDNTVRLTPDSKVHPLLRLDDAFIKQQKMKAAAVKAYVLNNVKKVDAALKQSKQPRRARFYLHRDLLPFFPAARHFKDRVVYKKEELLYIEVEVVW